MVQLGLIGDNIARSRSPALHVEAGRLCGLEVTYERLIPIDLGRDFASVFLHCRNSGYRGINITYPYKEAVVRLIRVDDVPTAQIGACNTILFDADVPRGFNTDRTGFIAAFRKSFPGEQPGIVAMAGAGGVGKALAFALERLGARELRLFDTDRARASSLKTSIEAAGAAMRVVVTPDIAAAAADADGLVNCTPLGMVGHPGSAVPAAHMRTARWAFDAVYTPVDTQFVMDARAHGISVMSGYELFFHQAVDAFRLFTGCDVDPEALRAALGRQDAAA
ncbi:shikimate dehydrogenase [Aurantimonas sp. A2-1-M11]|uniref:shikimate dehydrogenase family protein n=1 Tax=Aurantimonas sp. A2-1-M11 TaxID=3113712 RepID=UPI002F92EBE9